MKIINVNAIPRLCLVSAFALSLLGCGGADTTTDTTITSVDTTAPVSDWQMVWEEEFEGEALNMDNWNVEVNCAGGGNQEQQCYTEAVENLFVEEGILKIRALKAADGAEKPYTSARINSSGKADFKYGRIEISAKMPSGQGTWPAFWMLPTDYVYGGWPKSGEIDIFETVNLGVTVDSRRNNDDTVTITETAPETSVFGTIHYGYDAPNNDRSGMTYTPPDGLNPADDFNTYAIEWQEGEIRWYMNGVLYAMQRASELRFNAQGQATGLAHRGWYTPGFDPFTGEATIFHDSSPFDQYFHLVLNLAIGGSFPENVNDTLVGVDPAAFENGQTLEVDWIRVYECSLDTITGKGCETTAPGYTTAEEDGGMFVEGKAPPPVLPDAPAVPLFVFSDEENPDWPLWDSSDNTAPEVVTDEDDTFGAVAEFRIINNDGAVLGFSAREGESDQNYNGTGYLDGDTPGALSFDMKVVSQPTLPTTWFLKVEAFNNTSDAELALTASNEGAAPTEGAWQTYTFSMQALADAGLDVSNIDLIMVFPQWQTSEGAVYRIDNMKITGGGGVAASITLFEDAINENWALWDCCGGTTPTVETVDAPYGAVAQFSIANNDGTVLGFTTRSGGDTENGGDAPFNASSLIANGVLQFDMRVVSAPTAATTWLLKVESDNAATALEVALNTSEEGLDPVTGEWQTYTFNISDLADGGLDVSLIDVIMIFPAWQTGAGAVYQVDNMKMYDPDAAPEVSPPTGNTIFSDGINANWALWDCCGGSEPSQQTDEAAYGSVAEFRIEGNPETVLGFNARSTDGGGGQVLDVSGISATGKFKFDMKVVTAPTGGATPWLLKIESDGNDTKFIQVDLNTSNEGAEPATGVWQTYTFDLANLSSGALDFAAIDVIMIFPTWGTGGGAVYRVDNVMFLDN
jgi:beta-glucanase (GH16 family)